MFVIMKNNFDCSDLEHWEFHSNRIFKTREEAIAEIKAVAPTPVEEISKDIFHENDPQHWKEAWGVWQVVNVGDINIKTSKSTWFETN